MADQDFKTPAPEPSEESVRELALLFQGGSAAFNTATEMDIKVVACQLLAYQRARWQVAKKLSL